MLLPPVALDHGAADWLDVPMIRCLTLPGTGAVRTDAAPTLASLADHVAGQLTEPVHLVGCSLGGMVAMHVALRHPELVLSLLPAYTTARAPRDAMLGRASRTAEFGAAALADENLARWFSPAALRAIPRPEPIAYAEARLRSADTDGLAAAWRAIAEHDLLDELASLRMPVTVVAGRHDHSVPATAAREIVDRVPSATLVETDDSHMGLLESPGRFSAIVRAHARIF